MLTVLDVIFFSINFELIVKFSVSTSTNTGVSPFLIIECVVEICVYGVVITSPPFGRKSPLIATSRAT